MNLDTAIKLDSFVYTWTNKHTGKQYIGYHKGTPQDGYVASSTNPEFTKDYDAGLLERDILYYGTQESAVEYERDMLQAVAKEDRCNYYNLAFGRSCIVYTEEVRAKMSAKSKKMWEDPEFREKYSGENHPMKRPENRAKITGENNPFFGKTHDESAKAKMSVNNRMKRPEAVATFVANHPMKCNKARGKVAISLKKYWEDPEQRAKKSDVTKNLWEDPEYRAKAIASNSGKNHRKARSYRILTLEGVIAFTTDDARAFEEENNIVRGALSNCASPNDNRRFIKIDGFKHTVEYAD